MRTRLGAFGALALISIVTLAMPACDDNPNGPSEGTIVTFQVVDETFRVLLTEPEQIDAARAAQAGGPARIPLGRVASGTQVNTDWSWHLEEVAFVEATVEVCDGLPSHVEGEGPQFGNGFYCPWSATIISIDERD